MHKHIHAPRKLITSMALAAALAAPILAGAQGLPQPTIQITAFNGVPSGGCTAPRASVTVFANGTAANSDNFVMLVNGTLSYTWTGETMGWSPAPPGGPHGYGINGLSGSFAANSIITGRIITYAGTNATAPNPTTGQIPVYESEISWDCTTGAQVGSIVNRDLRAAVGVPVNTPFALLAAALALVVGGFAALRRRNA